MIRRITAPALAALTLTASAAMPLAAHANVPQPKTEATRNAVEQRVENGIGSFCIAGAGINIPICELWLSIIEKFMYNH